MAKRNGAVPTSDTEVDSEELAKRLMRSTASGDLRDLLLDELKHHQKNPLPWNQKNPLPWNMRSEGEQHEIVNRVTSVAESVIRQLVRLIAADGRRTIAGTLEQFTAKDGLKATITFPGDDNTMFALNHARGAHILVVVSDAAAYLGESEAVRITPDQSTLLDDGGHEGEPAEA